MSQFAHFLRFFALADSGRTVPGNALTPEGEYPVLPAVPGDAFRWLVPKSDLNGLALFRAEIVLIPAAPAAALPVGRLRVQDCENYVQFRLAVDDIPADGQQFALMHGPNDVPVLGTMTGSFADLNAYITAIQTLFEAYPHAPVITFRQGNELRVRIYRSNRFDPSDADLLSWRVGLGNITASAYNTNSPALTAKLLGTVTLPATDRYKVVVGDDIESGNVFSLQGMSYTATATDTPDSVLSALGIVNQSLRVASGSPVSLNVLPGTYRNENRNTPTLQLLYSANAGASDRYVAVVGNDVQPGNIYQVSAAGMTTKTVIATALDTSATIAAQFNSAAGFLLIPSGQNPAALTSKGSTTLPNTNAPMLYLTGKVTTPAQVVDQYRIFVGSSIRRGNQFVVEQAGLPTKTVVATATDQPVDIAVALGFSANPFAINVPTGNRLSVYARRGSRYAEPDDVSPVRLTEAPVCVRPGQYVAEVVIPANLNGLYSLGLRNRVTRDIFAQSNRLQIAPFRDESALLRWGTVPGLDQVFGFHYGEDGLTQQVRVPVDVRTPRQKTEESQYNTQSGVVIRTDLRVSYTRTLTTDMQPFAFHRALLLALKHPRLSVGGRAYRCLSDYRETEPTPIQQHYQAQAELTEVDVTSYRPARFDTLGNVPVARVVALMGTDVLAGLWLHGEGSLTTVQAGMSLLPGEYDLRAFCPLEAYQLAAYVNDRRMVNALLTVNRINRTGRIRLEPGDRLLLVAVPRTSLTGGELAGAGFPETADLSTLAETLRRGPDFNTDFNSDFTY